MSYVDDWKKVINQVRFNPHAIQRTNLSVLETVNNGAFELTDPGNPFVFAMEMTAVNVSAAMEHNESLNRQMYPVMALTAEELYRHMSDADYIGRFSSPGRVRMTMMFDRDEVYNRAVLMPDGRTKKLTIPRHTEISLGEMTFTLQYPIDMKIMAHGGLQITYDNDVLSPLETLSTNLVEWNMVRYQDRERIALIVPFQQFAIKSNVVKLTLSSAAIANFTFDNKFYYARVYRALNSGGWQEIYTTHTDQVFDPTKLTAVLRVVGNKLTVKIPQIYITTQLISEEIRVDIYTTQGNVNLNLEPYSDDLFLVKWIDYDATASSSLYTAPLKVFSEKWVFSDDTVGGGSDELPLDTLRNRVINNAVGNPDVPITPPQLSTRLENMGYGVVKDIDNVTNREFLATRVLPRPSNGSVISGAGCTIRTVTTSLEELVDYRTVRDNGERITLLPDTLYQDSNGLVSVVSDVAVDTLMAQPPDVRARRANENRYMYSPFHYVMDLTNNRFDHRAYYLDNPTVNTVSFIEDNDSTGYSVGTDRAEIQRTANGYQILLRTRSTENWRNLDDLNVHCQMAFRPVGERDFAYLNGTYLGRTATNERIFQFLITTNYDLDEANTLALTSFQMYTDSPREHFIDLNGEFHIFHLISNVVPPGYVQSGIDDRIGTFNLPPSVIGVSEDMVKVTLGQALTGLWTASRSVPSPEDYMRYLSDVPYVYSQTVFKRDPVTGVIEITLDGNGDLQYTILHNKGDPVLDQNGQPTIQHYAGDVKLDIDGNPVVISSRKLLQMVDLFFIEGAYWFATEAQAAQYQAEIPKTVASWLATDILPISSKLLDQTNLYFYPKSTLGYVNAIVRENERISIPAEQSFNVVYYLSADKYRDTALRKALITKTVETIYQALQSSVVTLNGIIDQLTETMGSDVIALSVTGLGGSTPFDAITLLDEAARLSIRKVARALEDNTIGVFDDVSISFIQHRA